MKWLKEALADGAARAHLWTKEPVPWKPEVDDNRVSLENATAGLPQVLEKQRRKCRSSSTTRLTFGPRKEGAAGQPLGTRRADTCCWPRRSRNSSGEQPRGSQHFPGRPRARSWLGLHEKRSRRRSLSRASCRMSGGGLTAIGGVSNSSESKRLRTAQPTG